jgi:hypothetical protein
MARSPLVETYSSCSVAQPMRVGSYELGARTVGPKERCHRCAGEVVGDHQRHRRPPPFDGPPMDPGSTPTTIQNGPGGAVGVRPYLTLDAECHVGAGVVDTRVSHHRDSPVLIRFAPTRTVPSPGHTWPNEGTVTSTFQSWERWPDLAPPRAVVMA